MRTLPLVIVASVACASERTATTTARSAEVLVTGDVNVHWDVTVSDAYVMDQRVCFDGFRALYLMPEARRGLRFATVSDDDGDEKRVSDRGVKIDRERCLTVRIDLRRAAREIDNDEALTMFGDAIYGTPDVWLWRPEPWPLGARGTLTMTLPEDVRASVPWHTNDEGAHIVDATTWRLMSRFAIGKLETTEVQIGDAEFAVAKLPGRLSSTDEGLAAWLESAAQAVSTVSGRFPVRRVQVLVVPVGGGRSVPFGMMMRGGGATALMLVSGRANDDDLLGEWVSVHELSHLLLPPVDRKDAWLSEGLASYYQNILRVRAGLLSEEEGWGLLVDGFDRGRKNARDRPLADASRHMHRDFEYLHVYWGGAAIALALDVALREAGSSLDHVVSAVRKREPRDVAYRSADEVIGWMTEAAPTSVDVRGIVERGLSERFPDVEPALKKLGVRRGRGQEARLDDNAPLASVRRGIAQGKRIVSH